MDYQGFPIFEADEVASLIPHGAMDLHQREQRRPFRGHWLDARVIYMLRDFPSNFEC